MLRERRAPLEAQRHVRDPPAVVLVADQVGDRHPDLVEEDLAEVALAVERPHRAHLDALAVHVEDEPRDALVLRRVGIGAHEQLAPVGDVRARAPDLLARHDVVVAVAHGPGAQRREVRAGRRLGEPLAPDVVAPQDPGQVEPALRLGALGDERRAGVHHPDEVDADVRRLGAGVLLEVHELLGDRQAAAAGLDGPRQPGVPGIEEAALPRGVVGPAGRPVARWRRRAVIGHGLLEPGPHLGPEPLVGFGVAQVHGQPFTASSGSVGSVESKIARTPPRSTLPESVRGSTSTSSMVVGIS